MCQSSWRCNASITPESRKAESDDYLHVIDLIFMRGFTHRRNYSAVRVMHGSVDECANQRSVQVLRAKANVLLCLKLWRSVVAKLATSITGFYHKIVV